MTNSHALTCIVKKERKEVAWWHRTRAGGYTAVQGLSICYPMRWVPLSRWSCTG